MIQIQLGRMNPTTYVMVQESEIRMFSAIMDIHLASYQDLYVSLHSERTRNDETKFKPSLEIRMI